MDDVIREVSAGNKRGVKNTIHVFPVNHKRQSCEIRVSRKESQVVRNWLTVMSWIRLKTSNTKQAISVMIKVDDVISEMVLVGRHLWRIMKEKNVRLQV